MMAQEPIPYVLSDPADDVDHGLHQVDSSTRPCCAGIGAHTPTCRALAAVIEDAFRQAAAAAEAVALIRSTWPNPTEKMADHLDFVAGIAAIVPQGIAALRRTLDAKGDA